MDDAQPEMIPVAPPADPAPNGWRDFRTAEVPEERRALVKLWGDRIASARDQKWDRVFKAMRTNSSFARGHQWPTKRTGSPDDPYVANVTLRSINQRVAELYAKNPRAVAKRRKRLDFRMWDGRSQSLQQASMAVQQAMETLQEPPAEALLLLQDVASGHEKRKMLDRIGKTLSVVFDYSLEEQKPRFKLQMKQLIRRALTCKVGYVKVGYQRIMGQPPNMATRIADTQSKLDRLEQLIQAESDPECSSNLDAQRAELSALLKSMQAEPDIVLREGLVFSFPRSWSIIIDPDVQQIKGFVGAKWIAEERPLDCEEVERTYKVKLGSNYKAHTPVDGDGAGKRNLCMLWEVYDLVSGMRALMVEGAPDFIEPFAAPEVRNEQGHPYHALPLNEVEDPEDPFPESMVDQWRPIQYEINRSRQALREHRMSNRPAFLGPKGVFSEPERMRMQDHAVSEFIEIGAMKIGDDPKNYVMAKPTTEINPNIYDTEYLYQDGLRVVGDQEANLGPTSNATATESTIAETSRAGTINSDKDDLDEFLTDLARDAGQILLTHMSKETVVKIAGDGAAWPSMTSAEIAEEIYLEIKAGSSGRPNKALRMATIERYAPYIERAPGLNPQWWLETLLQDVDDVADLEDAIVDGAPSIAALNSMMKPQPAPPDGRPGGQQAGGAENEERPPAPRAGSVQNQSPSAETPQIP